VTDTDFAKNKLILSKLDLQHERRALLQHSAFGHRYRIKIEAKITRQLTDQRIESTSTRQHGSRFPVRTRDNGGNSTRLPVRTMAAIASQLAELWAAGF
jgi:hypothetical protein